MATDWAVEVFKVAGTGLSVFIGARIAFNYAEKGRRNDIYYKERFKAYQEATSLLVTISMNASSLKNTLSIIDDAGNVSIALTDFRRRQIKQYTDNINQAVLDTNHSVVMLLPEQGRTEYLRILRRVRSAISDLWLADIYDNSASEDLVLDTIRGIIARLDRFGLDADRWMLTYIRELDIPDVDRIVGDGEPKNQLKKMP